MMLQDGMIGRGVARFIGLDPSSFEDGLGTGQA